MLHAEDLSGAVSSEFTSSFPADTGCWPLVPLSNRGVSEREGYPRANVSIELEGGVVVRESLIYDASRPNLLSDFHYAIDACFKMSPFQRYSGRESGEVSEMVEFIDAESLPQGVLGYTHVVTNLEVVPHRVV